jgi:hypothetical protein
MHDDVFASHDFADLHRADVAAVARLDCREYFGEKFLPTTGTPLARHSSESLGQVKRKSTGERDERDGGAWS